MVTVTVLRDFYDLKAHADRTAGDTFLATEERAAQLDAALPGYVTCDEHEQAPELRVDLSKMTNAQLIALCEERGIQAGKRPTKAQLIRLLQE